MRILLLQYILTVSGGAVNVVLAASHEGDDTVTSATVLVYVVTAHSTIALALLHQLLLRHRRDLSTRHEKVEYSMRKSHVKVKRV